MRKLKNLCMILAILCFLVSYYFQATNRIYSLIALAIGILIFPYPFSKKGYLLRALASIACIAFAVYIYLGHYPNSIIQHEIGTLTVHYIDVGQGESTFIELPDQTNILIDAGEYDQGDKVSKYIKALGYDTIDYLVITHSHSDHIGGMNKVLTEFKVKHAYMNDAPEELNPDSFSYNNTLRLINNKNIPFTRVYAGDVIIDENNVFFHVISPKRDMIDTDLNQYSLITRLKFANTGFVFTADAGYRAEFQIEEGDISANILQIGHHGSNYATSTQFLKRVSPDIAIISVGRNNENNLPNVNTLTSIDTEGILIYRTDESGTITIASDGNKITSVATEYNELEQLSEQAQNLELSPNN